MSGSKKREVVKTSLPRLLKYSKLAQVSKIQYGWTSVREMMKTRLPHSGRKGLILSHEMTLCSVYDTYKGTAVLLRILILMSVIDTPSCT